MNNKFITILSFLFISIVFAGAALAAPAVPDISDAVKQAQPPIQTDKTDNNIPVIKQNEPEKVQRLDTGVRMYVKKFKIRGNNNIASEELLNIVNKEENLNKEYSYEELGQIASTVTKYYRLKGYFVARAYFPKQDVVDSVIELDILEGYYGQFRLKNKSLVGDSTVQGMLDDIKDKNIISVNTIERAMLIINDTPGAVVSQAEVMPGSDIGTSDFLISTEATKRYTGYAVYDNYGSRYTGKNRFMAGLNINSPFALGDKINLSAMTTDSTGIINGGATYSMPLMYNGLRGELSYARTNYELGREYDSLDADGTSDAITFALDYPAVRTKLENLTATADFSVKKNVDKINSTDSDTKKKLLSASFGLDYNKIYVFRGMQNSTAFKSSLTAGNVSFDDDESKAVDEAGADTNGVYSKIYAEFTQDTALTGRLSLTFKLKGQHSVNNKNLDGSEDISVGGSNGVRLFPSGEMSAENGYVMNIETAYALPVFYNVSGRVGLFYDIASASMQKKVGTQPDRTIQDTGIGYYANYKNAFLKAEYAVLTGGTGVESEPEYKQKFLIQGGLSF